MQTASHPLWLRIGLGLLALVILAFTLPAYLDTANNPGLANLSGEAAGLGSVAGAFLGRQLSLALIAGYGAWDGRTQPMLIGAFAIGFFNLHDAVLLFALGAGGPGAVAGLILGGAAMAILVAVRRAAT